LKVPPIVAQILSKFSLDFSKPDELQSQLQKEHAIADRLINNSLIDILYIYACFASESFLMLKKQVCVLLFSIFCPSKHSIRHPLPEPALLPFDG